MMKNYLRELWRGTWHPSKTHIDLNETLAEKEKLEQEIRDVQHKLSIDLDQGQMTLLVEYDRKMKALIDIMREDGFAKGCSFMSKLLLSALSEEENE